MKLCLRTLEDGQTQCARESGHDGACSYALQQCLVSLTRAIIEHTADGRPTDSKVDVLEGAQRELDTHIEGLNRENNELRDKLKDCVMKTIEGAGYAAKLENRIVALKLENDELRGQLKLSGRGYIAKLECQIANLRCRKPTEAEMENALGPEEQGFLDGVIRRCLECSRAVYGLAPRCETCVKDIEIRRAVGREREECARIVEPDFDAALDAETRRLLEGTANAIRGRPPSPPVKT